MNEPNNGPSGRPYMIIGAGELISHVHRVESAECDFMYRFNFFRTSPSTGTATQSFRPDDLRDVVKTCQVLAFAIADDGWISRDLRKELTQLGTELDQITIQWGGDDA